MTLFRLLSPLPFLLVAAHAAVLEVRNESVIARYDDAARTWALADAQTGVPFVTGGEFRDASGSARVEAVSDTIFGRGQRILVPCEKDSGQVALETYPGLPFALIKRTVKNSGGAVADFPDFTPATFTLSLGKPATALRTLGTGGLLPPDKNPGSYLSLIVADPASRAGVVAGWVSQERASGVVFSSVSGQGDAASVKLSPRLDFSHLVLKPGARTELETLAVGRFADARLGAERFADAVARRHAIRLKPATAVYCSWYSEGKNHGRAGTPATTAELSAFVAKHLKPYGLGVVQLDDGWQDGPQIQGPATEFDRVSPKGPYAEGLASTAKKVNADGLTFGIWWLPFGRNHMQPEYADKQDWFVKKPDGTPLRQRGFGGTCLDATNPAAAAHLEKVAAWLRRQGSLYFKMDGLSAGAGVDHRYINDGYKDDAFSRCLPRAKPEITSIEAMRFGLKAIRKGAGPEVFFSGCCASQNMRIFAGSIGLVDAMRVGPDFNHDGQGLKTGPLRATRLWFMNGRIWWNDPDPSKVRASGEHSEGDPSATGAVSLDQARLTTSWVSLSRQFFLISDWLPALPEDRLEVLRRTMATFDGVARPVDVFDRELANTWLASSEAGGVKRHVAGVFNFDKSPLSVEHSLEKLGVDPSGTYHAFDFWANKPLPDVKGSFLAEVGPASCRIIALRAKEGRPVLLSTSRHVSQGMLEVSREIWAGKALTGASSLIGGDACELRIAGVSGRGVPSVEVAREDAAAGVTIAAIPPVEGESDLLRVRVLSPKSRVVRWRVSFPN